MKIDTRAFRCFYSRRLLLSVAIFSAISWQQVVAQSTKLQSDVTTVGGVVYSDKASKVTKVTSSLTDVYLTKAAISETSDA